MSRYPDRLCTGGVLPDNHNITKPRTPQQESLPIQLLNYKNGYYTFNHSCKAFSEIYTDLEMVKVLEGMIEYITVNWECK